MATLMLEGGADIRFIHAMLGHTDLQATSIYTQVAITKLKEVHTAMHPGARLRVQGNSPERPQPPPDPDDLQAQLLRDLGGGGGGRGGPGPRPGVGWPG